MSNRKREVLKAALTLAPEELAELLDELNVIASEHPDPAVVATWAREIERRLQAYDAGEVRTVSWEDIERRLSGGSDREHAQG